jgi:hypothetical protein
MYTPRAVRLTALLLLAGCLPKLALGQFAPTKVDFGPSAKASAPFRLENGHIYFEASIGTMPKSTLVLDSGAGATVLRPETVAKLGLTANPAPGAAIGAGGKTVPLKLVNDVRIQLGEMQVTIPTALVLPLPDALPCDAILGIDVFRQCVVSIDYENRRLSFHRAEGFTPQPEWKAVPLRMSVTMPSIAAEIDGLAGQFGLDTGAGDALTVHTPFVERNRMADLYNRRLDIVTGAGVGGFTEGTIVRSRVFKIGEFEMKDLIISLSRMKTGAMANPRLAGNVGAEILKQFTVTFDIPGERLFLAKNANFGKSEPYSRSGMAFYPEGGVFSVIDVVADGPAAKAGVQKGDQLVSINDKPMAMWHFGDLRMVFRQDVGTKVKVVLRRSDKEITVEITLRDLI